MLYLDIAFWRAKKSARRIYRILAEKMGVKGRICFILCEVRWLCQNWLWQKLALAKIEKRVKKG